MSVPETSVHKNDCLIFSQNDIGMTWQSWMMQPITKSETEQELPYQHLRFGVLAFYRRHATMSLFFRQFICHRQFIEDKNNKFLYNTNTLTFFTIFANVNFETQQLHIVNYYWCNWYVSTIPNSTFLIE